MATSSRFSFRRLPWLVFKAVIWFVVISVAWVALYRFVPPPVTFTMLGNALDGRGIHKDWMPLSAMDPDMARAAIAGEDAKFCSHHGFDFEAIEDAYHRNARGKRIRGGSTISQQTAKNARSEEHTSELQSLMRISYAVFCLKKKKNNRTTLELKKKH